VTDHFNWRLWGRLHVTYPGFLSILMVGGEAALTRKVSIRKKYPLEPRVHVTSKTTALSCEYSWSQQAIPGQLKSKLTLKLLQIIQLLLAFDTYSYSVFYKDRQSRYSPTRWTSRHGSDHSSCPTSPCCIKHSVQSLQLIEHTLILQVLFKSKWNWELRSQIFLKNYFSSKTTKQ